MFRSLRNFTVNIFAAFIRDKDERQKFRSKYKIKSKFRKLRDDNQLILNENNKVYEEIKNIKGDLAAFREMLFQHLREWEAERALTFRVTPLDISSLNEPQNEVFLAIACVAKNEGPYLKEWIEYHKIVGVERFYFYDNDSDDNTKEILEPYINAGIVVYHFLANHPVTKQLPQAEAYNDAIYRYRDKTRWMAFIDIDEFIVPVEKYSIPEFLADYEPYPGIEIYWICFDSNGHEKKPTTHGGLVTANYTRVKKDHNDWAREKTVKSIVNPKRVVFYTVHHGRYYQNFVAVTENFQKTRDRIKNVHSSKKIRINHYETKSREEYLKKIKRNYQATYNTMYKLNEDILNFKGETIEDLVIQKYMPELKKALGIKE